MAVQSRGLLHLLGTGSAPSRRQRPTWECSKPAGKKIARQPYPSYRGSLEVVAMARHTANHVADAAPGVEAAMQEAQLGLARLEGEEAQGSAEEARHAEAWP